MSNLKLAYVLFLALTALLGLEKVHARGQYIDFWEGLYPNSRSSETGCQLCHQSSSGGDGGDSAASRGANVDADQQQVRYPLLSSKDHKVLPPSVEGEEASTPASAARAEEVAGAAAAAAATCLLYTSPSPRDS